MLQSRRRRRRRPTCTHCCAASQVAHGADVELFRSGYLCCWISCCIHLNSQDQAKGQIRASYVLLLPTQPQLTAVLELNKMATHNPNHLLFSLQFHGCSSSSVFHSTICASSAVEPPLAVLLLLRRDHRPSVAVVAALPRRDHQSFTETTPGEAGDSGVSELDGVEAPDALEPQ